jgi:hypothetical protein
MRKYAVTLGLMLLLLSPATRARAVEMQDPGDLPPDRVEMQDKSKEDACDCCQKCKAAKKPVQSKEEAEGPAKKNGCEDCCERCGRALPPAPEESPPDIIDKQDK